MNPITDFNAINPRKVNVYFQPAYMIYWGKTWYKIEIVALMIEMTVTPSKYRWTQINHLPKKISINIQCAYRGCGVPPFIYVVHHSIIACVRNQCLSSFSKNDILFVSCPVVNHLQHIFRGFHALRRNILQWFHVCMCAYVCIYIYRIHLPMTNLMMINIEKPLRYNGFLHLNLIHTHFLKSFPEKNDCICQQHVFICVLVVISTRWRYAVFYALSIDYIFMSYNLGAIARACVW